MTGSEAIHIVENVILLGEDHVADCIVKDMGIHRQTYRNWKLNPEIKLTYESAKKISDYIFYLESIGRKF